MRTCLWMTLAVVLVVAGAACSTPAPQPEPSSQPAAPALPAAEASAPAPSSPQTASEWAELLRQLKQNYALTDQQKELQANEHYRLAERYYQAGDLEKAEMECEKALKLNSSHAGANALFLEIQFLLGRGKATPASEEMAKYREQALVRHQQVLLEVDQALKRGQMAYNRGDYDAAEREFRTVLEYAKWMPTGVELETRRKEALNLLERTKEARRQRALDEERQRLRLIEEEKERENVRRLIDQKRELELLFGQAQMHFEREEYPRCVDLCERILHINPNLSSVAEMRNVAQRLQFMKMDRDNLKGYVEEWKRTFELIERYGCVQGDVLDLAPRDVWEEILKRKPKGIAELEEEIQPEDQAIADKLKAIKITIDMQNAPLTAVVEYIREISGLNIVIDTKAIEKPEEQMITIKVADIILDGALKLILGPKNWAHTVQDGTVVITSAEALQKKVKLELYDVQDLTYGIQDFPGVDISLSQDTIGTTIAVEEGKKAVFTGDDLANLIKNTIYKDRWEGEGTSCQFQNGLLIVRNAIDVHKAVRKFLSDLRATTGMLVSCETRFLMVEDDFLHQVGMDFRDLTNIAGLPARVTGITNLIDINPASITNTPFFVDPDGTGAGGGPLTATSAGISGVWGDHVARNMGARVQHIMINDFLVNRFYQQVLRPLGGATLQYTLLDDVSLEMILRLVSRSERNQVLTAPRLTLFNTQRGNFRISNQVAYVRDYDVQIATAALALDPIVDVVSDGISLDVRPVVSADRRFVTLELRPTVATLYPAPNNIPYIITNVIAPGQPVTDPAPIVIDTPIVHINRIRTTVVVPDRGTVMLGGMTIFFEENAESSIPVWRNIPVLGNLGSLKVKGLQRRQTLAIVTVRIIIPDEEARKRY